MVDVNNLANFHDVQPFYMPRAALLSHIKEPSPTVWGMRTDFPYISLLLILLLYQNPTGACLPLVNNSYNNSNTIIIVILLLLLLI